jgi:hypothetical protein
MGFDMYNMSNAISQGNMLSQSVAQLNDTIRQTNAFNASRAKAAVTTAVDQDKEIGLLTGIKEGASEVTALGNVALSVNNYKEAVANTGKPGFTEVKPTSDDLQPKAPAEGSGEAIDEMSEKPSAAIQTSEGTFEEGSDVLSKGKGIVAGGEAVEGAAGTGLKVAGAIGKGVGVLGGLATAGLDVAAEYKSLKAGQGLAGDNLAEKIANIGAIGGSALDMLGFVPGLQILGVVGSGIQAASGVLDEVGNAVETKQKVQSDQTTPPPATIQQTAQSSLAGSFANVRTG